jgi:hypothetical protein
MRLSAELIGSSEQRTNDLGEREIILRGLAIPAIEHLGVTRDALDAIDMTDNRISRFDNFPRLHRLSSLYLSRNVIETIDGNNLINNLTNLRHLDLSHNRISSLGEVKKLGSAYPKLEILYLDGNPVTRKSLLFVVLWLLFLGVPLPIPPIILFGRFFLGVVFMRACVRLSAFCMSTQKKTKRIIRTFMDSFLHSHGVFWSSSFFLLFHQKDDHIIDGIPFRTFHP